MEIPLHRAKRLLPHDEFQVVRSVARADSLPDREIARLRPLVREWRDKYQDRARRQARQTRGKERPSSVRGSASNENTRRQADVMSSVLERLGELEASGSGSESTGRS